MLRVEVAIRDGSAEGVQDEEQWNQVQSSVQVPGRTCPCFWRRPRTLEELEWVIGKQMGYYNNERRHSRLEYRSPVEYLTSVGFIPKMLVEIGLESGSVSGTQAPERTRTIRRAK